MRALILAFSAVLLAGGSMAARACDNPSLVMIPTKDKYSSKEEKKITEATRKYFSALQQYVACIQADLKSAGGDNAPILYRNVLVQRNNAAVAEAEAVQKWFEARLGKSASFEGPRKD